MTLPSLNFFYLAVFFVTLLPSNSIDLSNSRKNYDNFDANVRRRFEIPIENLSKVRSYSPKYSIRRAEDDDGFYRGRIYRPPKSLTRETHLQSTNLVTRENDKRSIHVNLDSWWKHYIMKKNRESRKQDQPNVILSKSVLPPTNYIQNDMYSIQTLPASMSQGKAIDKNQLHSSSTKNEYKRNKNLRNTEADSITFTNDLQSLASEDYEELKFPQKEIVNKLHKMMSKAHNLNQLQHLPIEENLPDPQRRYANSNLYSQSEKNNSDKWDIERVHFTTISVGTLMLFLILAVMVLALRVHCRNREKTSQEWIRHPVVQPSTASSDSIQPTFKHILHPDHLASEPIRIKAKGLLERRGSNTSLTIDLGSGGEGADVVFSPSRECTPADFLMTAGSRMNRRQLRQCLKDPRELHAEFWQIPSNHPDKCSVPGAAAKNRYRTVLPIEETRVVLYKAPPDSPETPASQYINANYIKGYDGEEKAYIATQGPLANTVEDLWLLVLQERSPAIIMITRLKEKGRVKCEPYVPSYAATYGSIHVTVKQIIQKNGYAIRQIYLKRGDESHTTLHFWFTSWPDHKTPASARHLLAMASEVENARKECQRPVIVHCSAGIGRTGCFIAVSIGRIQLFEEDCVDILSIVCQMRLDRGGLVQTAEQYEFIHRALALFEASLPSTASSE